VTVRLKIYYGRECGDCSECCTHLGIPAHVVSAAAKPAGEGCRHLCDSGCGIYDARPGVCARFRCAWLADHDWPDAWRPDQSGLLCLREFLDDGLPAALVSETRPGALLEPAAKEILLRLLENTSRVVVVGPDGKRHLMVGSYATEAAPAIEAETPPPLRLAA
jgi:hypothetical protein